MRPFVYCFKMRYTLERKLSISRYEMHTFLHRKLTLASETEKLW